MILYAYSVQRSNHIINHIYIYTVYAYIYDDPCIQNETNDKIKTPHIIRSPAPQQLVPILLRESEASKTYGMLGSARG